MIHWIYNDGGRQAAGYKGTAGDCGVRAIAIATGLPYQDVYDLINEYGSREYLTRRKLAKGRSGAHTGVYGATMRRIMEREIGWLWRPCMAIGTGCKVHLSRDELPSGRIILSLSRHYAAVIDGILHDTYDCSRGGTRCVYGYWESP